MLVKLHSTEITTQKLPINLHTLTSRCCFGLCISQLFICFVSDPVGQIEIVFVSVHWQQMKLIGKGGNKEQLGKKKSKVMEYKVATLLLFSKGGPFVM